MLAYSINKYGIKMGINLRMAEAKEFEVLRLRLSTFNSYLLSYYVKL